MFNDRGRPWGLIRQIVPYRQSTDSLNPESIFDTYTSAVRAMAPILENESVLLDLSKSMFDSEEARRLSIDARAGQLLFAAGLLASLTGASQFLITPPHGHSFRHALSIISILVAFAYLAASAAIALKVQGEAPRSNFGPDEVAELSQCQTMSLAVAQKRLEYLVHNYRVNNLQSAYLGAAQKALRNGVLVILVASAIRLL